MAATSEQAVPSSLAPPDAASGTPEAALTLTERELIYELGWFNKIRWVIGALALVLLLLSYYVLDVRFRRSDGAMMTVAPAVYVVLVVFLYNAAFTFLVHILRARGRITRRLIVELALGQLACDMVAVIALAHFTGGVENFFLVLVLLPLVIATHLLGQSLAYATAGGAALLINALAWGEQQGLLRHTHAIWLGERVNLYRNPMYVLEVTGALTITIFATVFVASSISKRLRRREGELEGAYRALRQADESKSFFMRKAGHEMRAPLAAIYSILDAVAATSKDLDVRHQDLIARTQKRLRALMRLVDDLRRFSKLQIQEGPAPGEEPVAMDRVVRETAELFRPQAEAKHVTLTCDAEPVQATGDEELLREVVTNLIANAVQYTPSGGRIDVRWTLQGRMGVLGVADTGIGISEQAREGLFQEFYRAPEARKVLPNGTGLGLSITWRIVQMHGGQINFAPRPKRANGEGGGTIFTVLVPLEPGGWTPET